MPVRILLGERLRLLPLLTFLRRDYGPFSGGLTSPLTKRQAARTVIPRLPRALRAPMAMVDRGRASPACSALSNVGPVGINPIVADCFLCRREVELAAAHHVRELPFEPVLALGIPFRLDGTTRLRPKVRVFVRATKIERDQVIEFV
jgi:hypothetical protein